MNDQNQTQPYNFTARIKTRKKYLSSLDIKMHLSWDQQPLHKVLFENKKL